MNELAEQSPISLMDNSEIQHLIYSLWENKWLILAITALICALSGLYLYLKPAKYEANALIKIDSKNQDDSFRLSQFHLDNNANDQVASEMALIQSRVILEPIINQLGLAVTIEPLHFPIIGDIFASKLDNVFKISQATLPANYLNKHLILKVLDKTHYALSDKRGNTLLSGELNKLANNNAGFMLKIDKMMAEPGTEFYFIKAPNLTVVKEIVSRIRVEELGDGSNAQTGILQISLTDTNPERLTSILNAITELVQHKSAEHKMLETTKTLAFLNEQLPIVKASLERAESLLNAYRAKSGKINIKVQAEQMMEQASAVEKQIMDAKLYYSSVSQIYTAKHPLIIELKHKIRQLEKLKSVVIKRIKSLPFSDQVANDLMRDVKVKNDLYLVLLNKIQELRVINSGKLSDVRILAEATPPDTTIPLQSAVLMTASLILGLMVGSILVLIKHAFSRYVTDPQWVEKNLNLPNLAIIPYSKIETGNKMEHKNKSAHGVPILAEANPRDLSIEALRSLRTSFKIILTEPKKNIISFTGVRAGVGKSFVSSNFAYLLADTEKKVLLIDGDIRRGDLHHYFYINQTPGLIEVLQGSVDINEAIQPTSLKHLHFLPCGSYPQNPSELLMSNRFKDMLLAVASQYEYIVIDTAPVLAVTDGAIIGALADVNFLVLASNVHQPEEIILTVKQLEHAGIQVHGTIFNNLSQKTTNYGKYRYQYYNYYQSEAENIPA